MTTLQPNVLTVRADGSIGANFPGGVTIPASAGEGWPPAANQGVGWIRQSDGALVAELYGSSAGNVQQGFFGVTGTAAGDTSEVRLQALDDQAREWAALSVTQNARGNTANISAFLNNSSQHKRIIDLNGASDFLQLLSAQQLQLNFGSSTVTWDGINQFVNSSFAHGLGRTPKWVGLTSFNAAGGGWFLMINWLNATNVGVQAQAPAFTPPTRTDTYYWAAIG